MINVAIDGPAGAGKSTVAKAVAKKLGLIYLDTGAMYRATAYTALQAGIEEFDEQSVTPLLEDMKMDIAFEDGAQQIYVNGVNTTPYLREHRMSKAASDISALPCVRYKMVELQREFASSRDVVLDGRDIGTFVLPNANCKIFMTATPEERANRRFKELVEKGQSVDYDTLLADIKQRDYNDSHREVAPLKQADDAVFLDTTHMDIDEVVSAVITLVESKIVAEKSCENEGAEASAEPEKNDVAVGASSVENTPEPEAGQLSKKEAKRAARVKKYYKLKTKFGFYRIITTLARPFVSFFWRIKIVGAQNIQSVEDKGAIFICNHYSMVDTFLPCVKLFKREAHILAKSELFEIPVLGGLLHDLGAIPVRRGEADIDCVKCIFKLLKDGKHVMIFPEGTRNKQGTQDMGEIKSGAARFAIKTKSPIVPMMYYAPPKAFKRNYLYIGEPFELDEFYGDRSHDAMERATEVVKQKMDEVRRLVNAYVKEGTSKKGGKK